MPKQPISVVYAFNDRYVPFAAASLYSLVMHHRSHTPVDLHVLDSGVSPANRAALDAQLWQSGIRLAWYDVSPAALLARPNLRPYRSLTPHYHRLLIEHVVPSWIRRCIYLDVDTIILADIAELWSTPLHGRIVAACVDYLETVGSAISNCRALGIAPERKYFNTGVMLVDLDRWRAHRVSDAVLACTDANRAYLDAQGRFHQFDQYGLNVVLHDVWKELDQTWNYGSERPFRECAVIHFNGHGKPWSSTCDVRFSAIFNNHLRGARCLPLLPPPSLPPAP